MMYFAVSDFVRKLTSSKVLTGLASPSSVATQESSSELDSPFAAPSVRKCNNNFAFHLLNRTFVPKKEKTVQH